MKRKRIADAIAVLKAFGLPKEQHNGRSALSLLALLNLSPRRPWADSQNPLMGITPIMEWMAQNYAKRYKPNTRETVRRQTMHQFVLAGVAVYNPDDPSRPINSPKAVYQISPSALRAVQAFGTSAWKVRLADYLSGRTKLVDQYAKPREMQKVVVAANKGAVKLSPGKHSHLIKSIVEDFGGFFLPEGQLVYVGDTGRKHGYTDGLLLDRLGIEYDEHGKMPDVILYCPVRQWLVLIEAVTSHGPVDGKRHHELKNLFAKVRAGLVYVTAFATRANMSRYLSSISWETEVWVAEAPTHLIHFNGSRFLGPYDAAERCKDSL